MSTPDKAQVNDSLLCRATRLRGCGEIILG